jgi:hypothetical protein
MTELEGWGQAQLKVVLESMYKLARNAWDKDTLLRLNSYAHSTGPQSDLASAITLFTQDFISISADKQATTPNLPPSNFDTCVQLYKDPSIPKVAPALFGCVFVAILSLGHHSSVWNSSLTRRHRAVLYPAQVRLTSSSNELKNLDWLLSPVHKLPFFDKICEDCQSKVPSLWSQTFGQCGSLNSNVLLQDVTALAQLPQHRRVLAAEWKAIYCTGGKFGGFASFGSKCYKPCLAEIDNLIQKVYEELANMHNKFASYVNSFLPWTIIETYCFI